MSKTNTGFLAGVVLCSPLAVGIQTASAVPVPGGTLDPQTIPKYITAVEVLTYFESAITVFENNSVTIASLMVMMVVKFYLVAMYFMHLKQDNPLFTKLFVGGLALAGAVYVITLAAFEFWA